MASVLSAKHFHDETAALAFVEARVWPDGRACPHCGVVDQSTPLKGKSTRPGVYKCKVKECRKPFTVKVGTVFEASNVKLHVWLQAVYLMCSSKKGISSNQLARTLGVTVKTGWFMSHRIREGMRSGDLAPFGVGGGAVEADEVFIGNDPDMPSPTKHTRVYNKNKVLSLVDCDTGRVRSFVVDRLNAKVVSEILAANIAKEARLMTDEAHHYIRVGRDIADRQWVKHRADEYVRGDVYTNTIEGYFGIFKRGMKGVYEHCSKRHLRRYMAELDFRYSERGERRERRGKNRSCTLRHRGKRLKYRDSLAASV